MTPSYHVPVLLTECLQGLAIRPDGCYVDCTAGGGGHASAILERLGPGGRLLALDKDPEARAEASARLAAVDSPAAWEVAAGDFRDLRSLMALHGMEQADGVLADLGVSSHQLDTASRGFSFRMEAPLDMRMNPEVGQPASVWVATCSENELAEIFCAFGEERYARRIARQIVRERAERPLETTTQLSDCICRALPAAARREKQHPAKRVFQALRIAVNGELEALDALLDQVPDCLAPGGRLAIITFHSLEDRRVKQRFRQWEHPCTCPADLPCVCGRIPLGFADPPRGRTAGEAEQANNPRARSARVRVFVREEEN